jgi:phosphate transport system protein
VGVLKINNDLERIADLAVGIAERAVLLASQPAFPAPIDVQAMGSRVSRMLKDGVDALVRRDADLARRVCAADEEVDGMHRRTYERVEEGILRNPTQVRFHIHYLAISRSLERIADHATNIAEDVIFMVEGRILRHHLGGQGH